MLMVAFGGLFVPLGFFLVLALRRLGSRTATVLAFGAGTALSATVEVLQLQIWTRSADVDDLILNSLGALIGAVLAVAVVLVTRTPRRTRARRSVPAGARRFG